MSRDACLQGTGIDLENGNKDITLEQEFAFYRNLLRQTNDPLLGLKLGDVFRPETYGLMGYAILSAQTFKESINLSMEFQALTFSHFEFSSGEGNKSAYVSFSPQYPIPEDLIQIYSDRDIQASIIASKHIQEDSIKPLCVYLIHSDIEHFSAYQEHFDCPVILGHDRNELHFEKTLLTKKLTKKDNQSSHYFKEQCQLLLEKLSTQSSLIESVRKFMIATPGYFPSIEEVASELNVPVRTLRRHLSNEGNSYRNLLNEIRSQLAKDYLRSHLSIEQISELLCYSEPANFSHAFKRWEGLSPKEFREQQQANNHR